MKEQRCRLFGVDISLSTVSCGTLYSFLIYEKYLNRSTKIVHTKRTNNIMGRKKKEASNEEQKTVEETNQIITEHVPKKRGRKPKKKPDSEGDTAVKVPKKRGRKPKGGQIVKKNVDITKSSNIIYNSVILHLKCKKSNLKDINHNDMIYNPEICNVEPVDIDNNIMNTNFSYINDKEDTGEICNIENASVYNEAEVSKDKTKKSSATCFQDQEPESSSKMIHDKIKELEINLHNNTVNKRSDCFWCTCSFDNSPIYIPKSMTEKKYNVYGNFCSPECACSFLFNEHIDDVTKFERYQLLNFMYSKAYNYTKNIKPAPNPYYTLDKYMGNLSIKEWRSQLKNDRLLIVVDKPLTKIFPELYEDNNEFEIAVDNKFTFQKKAIVNKNDIIKDVFSGSK